jgi:hypothetical protein
MANEPGTAPGLQRDCTGQTLKGERCDLPL